MCVFHSFLCVNYVATLYVLCTPRTFPMFPSHEKKYEDVWLNENKVVNLHTNEQFVSYLHRICLKDLYDILKRKPLLVA